MRSGPKLKPDDQKHTAGVLVRFMEADGEELRKRAAAEHMPLAQYIRWVVTRTLCAPTAARE